MHLDKRIKIQLAILTAIALVAGSLMIFGYLNLPAALFGIGRYTVTVELPRAAGLYDGGNVTYRGTEVGRVTSIEVTDAGVAVALSLRSDVPIPSDLDAEVHSVSSIGEQFLALSPRNATARPLRNGDVVPVGRTSVPPDINSLIDATNRGLQAIPRDNLKTAVDESYTAVGGLGPEISRLVRGSTATAIDARANLDSLTTLIDESGPVLDSQSDSADAIDAWAAHVDTIAGELKAQDAAVAGWLQQGAPAANEARELVERLRPTLPVVLANMVSVEDVAIAYQPNIEQLLVLAPQITSEFQGGVVAAHNTKQDYKGAYLDFNLNLNLPPPCTTGYLPPQQIRSPSLVDYPDIPAGDMYCRVPQDSGLVAVRGARNTPCATVAGKRAPTAKLCESNEQYTPLNDGTNWKGDPNATLSGQAIPDLPPQSAPQQQAVPPPLAVTNYDPATGSYLAPDGRVYTQPGLASGAQNPTWQSMLSPPAG
ncbi:MCE family protein [Mycolicibacterium sp. CH28]|uniref:MCE family protein n=1 Tax=Mycolicibacterium sp. CH28 TaxID=2512237 RepID=UPI0010819E0E|nr:MlaD family protein [Mycolicibacterium sp. CH28]TGD89119.1 MCE family protein [Mycolicibacterium sp. CH28]